MNSDLLYVIYMLGKRGVTGVVPERDQLEFTIRNRSEMFRVERILLLPLLFLEVFLDEPKVKFNQV